MMPYEFTLTEQHVALLRKAHVRWWSAETGAPAICPKRPYGNSNVEYDVAEILGIEIVEDDYGDMDEDQRMYLAQIHRETEVALQIVLATGAFKIGKYARPNTGIEKYDDRLWKLVEE